MCDVSLAHTAPTRDAAAAPERVESPQPEASLFRRRARAYQKSAGRTRRDAVGSGGVFLAIGAGGSIVLLAFPSAMAFFPFIGWGAYVLGRFLPEWAPRIVAVAYATELAVLGVSVAVGLHLVIRSARSVQAVTCPRCAATYELFSTVTVFTCESCHLLLRLGGTGRPPLVLARCAYCRLEAGEQAGVAPYFCSNCGLRRIAGETERVPASRCMRCGHSRPANALVCRDCGFLVEVYSYGYAAGIPSVAYDVDGRIRSFDMDWICGKDPAGHRQFATGLLEFVVTTAVTAPGLDAISSAWPALTAAIDSIDEGCLDPDAPEARLLLERLQEVYGTLLAGELAIIRRQPKAEYEWAALRDLFGNRHLAGRRHLEKRFATALARQSPWAEDCSIVFEQTLNGGWVVKDARRVEDALRRLSMNAS